MFSLSRPTSSSLDSASLLPSSPSSSQSSSSSSSNSSMTETLSVGAIQTLPPVGMVREDDPTSASDRSGSSEQSSPQGFDWVDPKVTWITCLFVKRDVVAEFLDQVGVLELDVSLDVISIESCELTDVVCSTQSSTERPFFYIYACLFSDLHVSLPFDNFAVGVLRALHVAPTQLHPNTWVSIQAFRLVCDVFRLSPTPSTFLSYYTSHPTKLAL